MLIATEKKERKKAFFDEKISESAGKAKELWNALGMHKKTVVSNFNTTDDKSLTNDIKVVPKVFFKIPLKFSGISSS